MQQTKLFFPLPLDIKTYLEETFGVKVNQVVFTYNRKDIAKIESKLKSVEKSLEYCRRYPNTKLWSCRTSTESALKYYEKLGWHFISSIFPFNFASPFLQFTCRDYGQHIIFAYFK